MLFNDRPAFSSDPNAPILRDRFNPNPAPGETIIPRNYGAGPGMFSINLRLSRTFGFGEPTGSTAGPGSGFPQGGLRLPMGDARFTRLN